MDMLPNVPRYPALIFSMYFHDFLTVRLFAVRALEGCSVQVQYLALFTKGAELVAPPGFRAIACIVLHHCCFGIFWSCLLQEQSEVLVDVG